MRFAYSTVVKDEFPEDGSIDMGKNRNIPLTDVMRRLKTICLVLIKRIGALAQ
jgi:hypothetical protein